MAVDLDSAGCVKAKKKEYSGFDPLQNVCACTKCNFQCACVCVLYLIYAKVCDCHNSFSSTLVRVVRFTRKSPLVAERLRLPVPLGSKERGKVVSYRIYNTILYRT